jgi:hypothetical protein
MNEEMSKTAATVRPGIQSCMFSNYFNGEQDGTENGKGLVRSCYGVAWLAYAV